MASPRFVRGRRSAALTLVAAAFVALPASASMAAPAAPAAGTPATPPSSVTMTVDQQCTTHGVKVSVSLHNKGTNAASASLSWGDVQAPAVEIAAGGTRTQELPLKPGTKVEALVRDDHGGAPQHLAQTVKAQACSLSATGAPLPRPKVDYRLVDSCGPDGAHAPVALLKNTGKTPATVTLSSGDRELSPIELAPGEARERTLPAAVGASKVELAAITAGAEKGRTALQLRKSASTRGHACEFRAPGELATGTGAGGAPGQLGSGLLRLTAFDDGTGSISGKVVADVGGAGLPNICVHLSSDEWDYGTTTLANGTYSLTGIAAASYYVWFEDCGTTGTGYVSEYYDDATNVDEPTTVTVGTTAVTGINAGLAKGGAISGKVTAQTGGAALANMCVDAESETTNYYGEAYTSAGGTYTLRGIPAASDLVVSFFDCDTGDYIGEFYDNATTYESATPVTVAVGATKGSVNAALATGGRIAGKVTAQVGGAALSDICVSAETADGDTWSSSSTASDGTYVVRGLATAQYIVQFYDCEQGLYASEFYNDKTTWDAANPVSVTAPTQVSGINAALVLKGKITGKVTAEVGGAPLADMCVAAESDGDSADTTTAADGTYSLNVASGSYIVSFYDCSTGVFIGEYWNNVSDPDLATAVTVTSPATVPNINAALAKGASITGKVTAQMGGAPLADVCVDAWSESIDDGRSGYTAADGTYTIPGLRTAPDYAVTFYDCDTGAYASEKWNDQPIWSDGTPLSLTAPNTTPNINAALASAGSISGTVTAQGSNAPLPDMCVDVLGGPDHDQFLEGSSTEADGTYAVNRLPAGDYKVRFTDCDQGTYAGEFYNNVTAPASAALVTVTASNAHTGVNAQLTLGGSIHGTVTDASTHLPLSDVCVSVWTSDHVWEGYGYTGTDGTYTVGGLPSGSYVVDYEYCEFDEVGYQSEFYNNVLTEAAATKVNVTAGAATNNINADLAKQSAVNAAGLLTPVPPARLLDTRSANGVASKTPVPSGGKVDLQVAGRGGVPATGAGAVVLNVTVTSPTGGGFITVFPSDVTMPTASNLNFSRGQTIPNHVTVKLSGTGKVSLYNGSGGTVHLIADVAGWYASGTPTEAGALTAVTPARILDTRNGTGAAAAALGAGQKLRLQVAGKGGVPAGTTAAAVALNVTVTGPTRAGYITAYPALTTAPTASNLNFSPGQTIPNAVTVKLGTDGYIELYNGSGGTVHLIADVAGWFRSGAATAPGAFTPLAPSRLVDTRSSQAVAAGQSLILQVAGVGGVPAGATAKAVVLNVTVTEPKAAGFITVFPEGVAPNASNLNFWTRQTIPNLVTVKVGADGKVRLYNGSGGTVHLIADVAGWYL